MENCYIDEGLKWARAGELHKAALSFCQAIKAEPGLSKAHQLLGEVLVSLENWDNAEDCFRQAISLKSDYAEAYNYLGIVFKHKGCYEKAKVCYEQAIILKPDYAEAFHNLGNCLKYNNCPAEAELAYRKALELKPELLNTSFSLATLYLQQGKYDKGWQLHELRLDWGKKYPLPIPLWQGENLKGLRILLFYEQGFGDMLQFIRYAYKVAEQAQKTTVWIQKPLARLLSHSQDIFSVCTSRKQIDLSEYDFACSIFSLPAKLNFTSYTFLADKPYLCAPREIAKKWRGKVEKIAGHAIKKIGVVWAGNPKHVNDLNRSIPFETFCRLFDITGVAWFSLQVGRETGAINMSWKFFSCSQDLVDFAETAAVIENLDLVISVDTAVAHLAGAMGKQTWLLLPFRSEWRWGLNGENCPWYPSLRLFRQSKQGDWTEVLKNVKNNLQKFATK